MKTYKENAGPVEKDQGQRVLIIDDDAVSIGVISDFLEDSGFVVLVARNGERGIERAGYARPDIIFLDVLMPGIDGFETCRRLKSDPVTADIPVIFMTALTDTEDKVKGFEAGAVDYVTKPFQSGEVLSRTRTQLRLSALTQELRHKNEELTKHQDHLEALVEERTAEIRAQSKFLQTAIDALTHPFYTVNIEDYSISHFNKAAGINISEKTSTCYALIYGRSEPCCKNCPIEEIKATGRPAMVEHIRLDKNGNERIEEIHAFPIFDKEGNLSEIIEYSIDITDRKQAEERLRESEEKLNTLLNATTDVAGLAEADGTFLAANDALAKNLGRKKEELIGKSMFDFLSAGVAERRRVVLQGIVASKKPLQWEDEHAGRYFANSVYPIFDDNGNVKQIAMFAKDTSERKQAENKLKESEAQLRQIIDLVPHFIFVKDETGKFEIVNKATAEVFGTTVEDLTGRRDSEFVATEEEMEHFRSDDLEVIRSGKTKFIPEEPITDSENNLRYLQTTKVPFNFSATKKPSLLGVAVDITRRVRAEEILALEKRRIAYILQGTNVGTWEWNVQTGETTFNERWAEIIGCTLEEISPVSIDTWMKFTHPDDLKVSGELLEKHFNGELDYYECEARMRHKNGDWVWVLDRGKVATWTKEGKPLLMSGTHLDITDRKQDEEQIAASLKEKEVLLREVHHRTKNNMQVMISLLKIQSANIEDKQVTEMFKESRDRIKSMSLVHEKLYRSKGLADVDFKGYVKSLVGSIFSSYGASAAGITSIAETDDVSIGLETAIPCGLIINELVSNSLKYAFPGNRKGEISVALRSFDEDALVLEVGDNGIGIPEDLDFRNTASMGLHLVHILSEDQLHGKIELDRAGGTTFRIRFKNHKYEARI